MLDFYSPTDVGILVMALSVLCWMIDALNFFKPKRKGDCDDDE